MWAFIEKKNLKIWSYSSSKVRNSNIAHQRSLTKDRSRNLLESPNQKKNGYEFNS